MEKEESGMILHKKWSQVSRTRQGVHEDAKSTVQSTVGQSAKQRRVRTQIENEEEEEEEDRQKEIQMEVQWAEDEKLEEILERRRMEGSPLQVEVMQKGTRVSGT